MDNDDIFATLDDDKTIISPAQSKQGFAKPKPGAMPGANRQSTPQDSMDPYLSGDAIDTITSIRDSGINPLVAAAAPLLSSIHRIQHTLRLDDINALRRRIVSEVQQYEKSAESKHVSKQNILVARYMLCAVLDETVLNTPWGSSGSWAHQTLLSAFHKESSGGEKFFIIVDRLLQDAINSIELLEMAAVCFGLGYKGKYRIDPMGENKLENLRNTLIARILSVRGQPEQALSPHWEGINAPDQNTKQKFPLWLVGAVTAAVLVAMYSGFNVGLNSKATPVLSDLERIGKPSIEQERTR